VKPNNVSDQEWDAIERAQNILTEYFPNVAIFVNWVNDERETRHGEILTGNTFAIKHHIERWQEGVIGVLDYEDEEE
jgi:hypothetical protein